MFGISQTNQAKQSRSGTGAHQQGYFRAKCQYSTDILEISYTLVVLQVNIYRQPSGMLLKMAFSSGNHHPLTWMGKAIVLVGSEETA
jgi:hypothetical protein